MSLKTLKEKALKNPSVACEYHKLSHGASTYTQKRSNTQPLSS